MIPLPAPVKVNRPLLPTGLLAPAELSNSTVAAALAISIVPPPAWTVNGRLMALVPTYDVRARVLQRAAVEDQVGGQTRGRTQRAGGGALRQAGHAQDAAVDGHAAGEAVAAGQDHRPRAVLDQSHLAGEPPMVEDRRRDHQIIRGGAVGDLEGRHGRGSRRGPSAIRRLRASRAGLPHFAIDSGRGGRRRTQSYRTAKLDTRPSSLTAHRGITRQTIWTCTGRPCSIRTMPLSSWARSATRVIRDREPPRLRLRRRRREADGVTCPGGVSLRP